MSGQAAEDRDGAPYAIRLSELAKLAYRAIPSKRDFKKVQKMIHLLDTVPEIGRIYDPDYPAARPPFEMRVVFAGRYGIYYVVEEADSLVRVLFIEDQRRDPLNRFYGIYPHESE